jgi:HK97 family phage prohead protease
MFCENKVSATLRERKRMDFALSVKSVDEEGRFAGYASVFDHVDNQRDVMLRGAFSRTIQGRARQVKLLWQHQQDEPIGVFDTLFEDAVGLYVEGRLLLSVQRAREAHALLKEAAISGLSIGYSPVRYRIDAETGVRYLAEVDLWEISLVTFPANSAANVTVVKSVEPILTTHELQEWQRAQKAGRVVGLSQALDRALGALL